MDSGSRKIEKIVSKSLKGEYQLPMWAAVFILVAVLMAAGGYYGWKKYAAKQEATNKVLTAQQTELLEAQKEIEALKNGGEAKKAEDIINREPTSPLATIIKGWRPRTAHIQCNYDDDPDNPDKGSGLWLSSEGVVITSRHVAERAEVGGSVKPDSCQIKLPGDEEVIVGKDDIKSWKGQDEITALFIANPTKLMKATRSTLASACASQAVVGEKIIILGYPSIGSTSDITVTEGIVSGYDEKDGNNFYITSAKIDKGHSGGAAVSIERNCYLGMPTFVRLGEIESLGRILNFSRL